MQDCPHPNFNLAAEGNEPVPKEEALYEYEEEEVMFHTQEMVCSPIYYFREWVQLGGGRRRIETRELSCPPDLLWNNVANSCSRCDQVLRPDGTGCCEKDYLAY